MDNKPDVMKHVAKLSRIIKMCATQKVHERSQEWEASLREQNERIRSLLSDDEINIFCSVCDKLSEYPADDDTGNHRKYHGHGKHHGMRDEGVRDCLNRCDALGKDHAKRGEGRHGKQSDYYGANCPLCIKHCEPNALQCEKGHRYSQNGETPGNPTE